MSGDGRRSERRETYLLPTRSQLPSAATSACIVKRLALEHTLCIELNSKATDVSNGVGGASRTLDCGETDKDGRLATGV